MTPTAPRVKPTSRTGRTAHARVARWPRLHGPLGSTRPDRSAPEPWLVPASERAWRESPHVAPRRGYQALRYIAARRARAQRSDLVERSPERVLPRAKVAPATLQGMRPVDAAKRLALRAADPTSIGRSDHTVAFLAGTGAARAPRSRGTQMTSTSGRGLATERAEGRRSDAGATPGRARRAARLARR